MLFDVCVPALSVMTASAGDERTAADARRFLLGFMKKFPHLRTNDLYLSGTHRRGMWKGVRISGGSQDMARQSCPLAERGQHIYQ